MGTIGFSKSPKRTKPSDNFCCKISETKNLFLYKKVKTDEPMNSNYCSPKFAALNT